MKKRPIAQRIGDFMAGKGFYIVLFLCVAAIGISGYYLFSSMSADESRLASLPTQVLVEVSPTPPVLPTLRPTQRPTPVPTRSPAPSPSVPPTPAPKATPAPTPRPTAQPSAYTWPVKGQILSDFSLDVLGYDQTMGDWRVHSALDIAADPGVQVRSIAPGTVSAVFEDDLMGTTVVIDHAGGIQSRYCNLAPSPTVTVGQEVELGQIIGSVGSSAIAESQRESHLHLEMTKNGESVDPANYLPA